MEENKPLVTETEYPYSDTDIISGDGTPIIDTSDQNVDTSKEESTTSKPDAGESTENSSTNTEENGEEEDTTKDPANDPATLESALLVSTYAALNKLAEYVPTKYVNNSEPDIDAEHLNNTEQGLLRVTNLLNGAVDVINDLQTTVAKQASAIDTLNSKNTYYVKSNSVKAVENNSVKIASITVPAGIYMVYAINDISIGTNGIMNSAITVTGNASIITKGARTDSINGGGAMSFGLVTALGQATISSEGYGYIAGTYNYNSIIVAIRL